MAKVWMEADVPTLRVLAWLVELVNRGEVSAALLAEKRQLEDRFGLSPLARRRLAWEIAVTKSGDAAPGEASDDDRFLRLVKPS